MNIIDVKPAAYGGRLGTALTLLSSAILAVLVAIATTVLVLGLMLPALRVAVRLVHDPEGLAGVNARALDQSADLFWGGFTHGSSPNMSLLFVAVLLLLAYAASFALLNLASWRLRLITTLSAALLVLVSAAWIALTATKQPQGIIMALSLAPFTPTLSFGFPEIGGGFAPWIAVARMLPLAAFLVALVPEGLAIMAALASVPRVRSAYRSAWRLARVNSPRLSWRALGAASVQFARVLCWAVAAALVAASLAFSLTALIDEAIDARVILPFELIAAVQGIVPGIADGPAFLLPFGLAICLASVAAWAVSCLAGRSIAALLDVGATTAVATCAAVIFAPQHADFGFGLLCVSSWTGLGLPAILLRGMIWRGLKRCADAGIDRLQISVNRDGWDAKAQPLLFLRAFKDDERRVGRKWSLLDLLMGGGGGGPRYEEVLAQRAFSWRPLIALANPNEKFRTFGAIKKKVNDADWQNEVTQWADRCAYVLILWNSTPNVAWEVEEIERLGRSRDIVFIFSARSDTQRFVANNPGLTSDIGGTLPANTLVLFHAATQGWTAITSRDRTPASIGCALDVALAMTESRLRERAESHQSAAASSEA